MRMEILLLGMVFLLVHREVMDGLMEFMIMPVVDPEVPFV
jgi:hypothetical protein